jgi:Calx-beta domain
MNRPLHTALALLPLLAVSLLPLKSAQAASSCVGFIPSTISTPANLITAINQAQSGNCPGTDTIDLGGNTITLTSAGFTDAGTAMGLPAVSTPITLTNGTITRSSAAGFRFLLVASGGALTLSNLTLSNGGGAIAEGGAVRVGDGVLTTSGATFLNNTASSDGGAVLVSSTGTIQFTDTLFQGNQAGLSGGAVAIPSPNGNVTFTRARFLGNAAGTQGSALSVTGSPLLQINDSLFAGNAASVSGATLYQPSGVVVVTGTTMTGNRGSAAELGAGVNSTFANSLIWGNSGGSFVGTPMVMLYTAAEGYAGATISTGYSVEEFFVSPLAAPTASNTGLNFIAVLYDWHLHPFAPAIDAASNNLASTLDLDSSARRVNDVNVTDTGAGTAPLPDLGAYERQASSCASYVYPYTLAGTANATRRLNLRDAVRCANLNGGADTIDLAAQTVTYDAPAATVDGVPTALPQITSAMTLRNGTILRATAGGTPSFRLLANAASGQLTLSGLTLRNGNAGNMVPASRGGAVYNLGTLTVQQSTLAGNAAYSAGALHNGAGANALIQRSTLADNTATSGASAAYSEGSLVLSNSTVSGNSSPAAASAVTAATGSQLSVVNSTIVDNGNTSTTASAGLTSSGATQLYNSILANNTPYDCARADGAIDFSAGTSNIVETQPAATPCGIAGTHLIAADPQLGAPAGSPAAYAPSSAASPAVNAGDPASIGGATLDQPGNARAQGTRVDLGSVESPFAGQQASIAFNAATSSAAEAAGFGNLVRVSTSDGAVTAAAITATVTVTGGTASAADYVRTGTLTIPAGTPDNALVSVASAITVTNESLVEADETLQLTLSAPAGAVLGTQVSTTHTLRNDDQARLTIADVSGAEGNAGSSTMTFTVTLDSPVQGGLVADYTTTGLTASIADNDFVAASGSLTFAGIAGETQSFNVTINGDTKVETNETFQLSLPSALATVTPGSLIITDTATGTITNDDTARLAIADASVTEGNAGTVTMTFTATLDNSVQGGFSVNYATSNGSATTADADYVAATGTLVFTGTSGETQQFSVTVNGDTRVEPNETFSVAMNTVSNAAVDISDTASGSIINDDTATLTIANVSVTEGNTGTRNLIFTVTLDNTVAGGFSVNYATANGTASTADNDYVAASGTLTFTGAAGQTRTFIVLVNGDTRLEADETLTVALNTVSNAAVAITDTATGTITNDDTAAVTIADVSVTEGNSGASAMTFTATLNNTVQGGFSVNYATANGSATTADSDYVAAAGTLTFAGTAGETQTFSVTVNGDTRVEPNETFTVSLNTVSNAGVTITDTAIGTISNDDTAAVTIADVSMAEGNSGTTLMTFIAMLDSNVPGGFTLNYATANGSATTADSDYAAAAGTLTFAGSAGEIQLITVTINGDTRVEPNETFSVSLNTPSNAAVSITDTAVGTITNDDTAAVTIADVSVVEGNSGTTLMTFTATLGNAVAGGFTVNYATANGTATTADNDYVAATGTLTFAGTAGETETFTVTVNGDTRVEPNETFSVSLNTPSNAAVTITDTAIGTITNDDTAAVTIADVSVVEGNSGTTAMTFTATLGNAVAGGFTVNYTTANGTATTADSDYVAASGTLTFAGTAGETQTFTVSVNGDTRVEQNETFTVSMNTVSNAAVTISDTAIGTINNDDTATLTIADVSVTEGNSGTSTMTFTATLGNAVAGGFTVNYATANGTATTADSDYVAASGTLTFAGTAGETQTFTVSVNGDTRVEQNETFTVSMNTVSNAAVTISDTAIGTINNDDTATLTIADVSVTEGNSGTSTMTFTATLGNAVAGGFTVNYATANGTATTTDNDYVAASGTLTFAGLPGETKSITVTINGDTTLEADETFALALSNASNPAVDITDTANGTLTNDDTAAVTIADVSVTEGNSGTSTMSFIATLGNAVAGGFTVNYATANGTATTTDNDYVAASGTLTFAGLPGETKTITVTINGDTTLEADETFALALSNASNPAVDITDTANGTLTNDDTAAVTIADVSVTEGNSGTSTMTFTATLGNAVAGGFTVNYATANGTATTAGNDYAAASGTLTFAGLPGETKTISVTINGDTTLEADETFALALSNTSNPAVDITDTATGTLTNDDTATVTLADASVTEGNAGTTAMTFTATLDNAVAGGFSVNYASANGTATTADNDYAAASGSLTFAGSAGETQTFTVTVNGDIRFEPDETFSVALSGVSNAAVTALDSATGTIRNDDTAPGFIVMPAAVQTTEAGGSASFTVALAAQPGSTVTLPLSSSDTGEGTVAPATLSFTSANWNSAQTVTVTGVDDAVVDGAVAYSIVLGAAASSDPAFDGLDPPDVSATNTDNDLAGVRVAPVALSATEGGSGASYTVVLDSEPVGGSVTVSASADSQLTATPASLVFTAANWNVAQTVTVTAVDDALAEGNHSGAITHAVSGADYGSVTAASVTVAITDNDTASILVTPATGLITTEAGGSATFTVTLASQPSAGVSIALSSSDSTEGTVSPAMLAFTTSNWNMPQTVTVTGVDDAVVDGDVAYTVITAAATSTDADYAGVDAADVAVSNRDDDGASLRIDDVTLAEGDAGSTAFVFTVTLTGNVAKGVRVNYATADGSALAPADYATTTGQLAFAGSDGETQTISVAVAGDTLVEGDEQFRVLLSGTDPAVVLLSDAEGTGTISDDDAAAQLAATKRVTQAGTSLQPVVYTLVVSNTGSGPQVDAAASDELVDVLPPGLALQTASASSGTLLADTATNMVRWNGPLAAGASATVEIRAAVVATTAGAISNRAQLNYDSNGDGINDTTAQSDDPTTPGDDATVFFFTPAGATPPAPVPLFGPWTLLALALGVAGLGARTLARKAAKF